MAKNILGSFFKGNKKGEKILALAGASKKPQEFKTHVKDEES